MLYKALLNFYFYYFSKFCGRFLWHTLREFLTTSCYNNLIDLGNLTCFTMSLSFYEHWMNIDVFYKCVSNAFLLIFRSIKTNNYGFFLTDCNVPMIGVGDVLKFTWENVISLIPTRKAVFIRCFVLLKYFHFVIRFHWFLLFVLPMKLLLFFVE